MNEQDCRAVENMALTGMELEGLYACFPKFPREEGDGIRNGTTECAGDPKRAAGILDKSKTSTF